MKKLSEKQGEKLPQDSVPSMIRCLSKGVAPWEGTEDANNGELSFKTLKVVMTPSDLCMSRVDSTLQHESAR